MSLLLREFLNSVLIIQGIFSAYMGLKGFVLSSNFIDGGVTGASMLLAKTTGWSSPLFFVPTGTFDSSPPFQRWVVERICLRSPVRDERLSEDRRAFSVAPMGNAVKYFETIRTGVYVNWRT